MYCSKLINLLSKTSNSNTGNNNKSLDDNQVLFWCILPKVINTSEFFIYTKDLQFFSLKIYRKGSFYLFKTKNLFPKGVSKSLANQFREKNAISTEELTSDIHLGAPSPQHVC